MLCKKCGNEYEHCGMCRRGERHQQCVEDRECNKCPQTECKVLPGSNKCKIECCPNFKYLEDNRCSRYVNPNTCRINMEITRQAATIDELAAEVKGLKYEIKQLKKKVSRRDMGLMKKDRRKPIMTRG